MCFFRKKDKKINEQKVKRKPSIDDGAKFKLGQFVHFRYREELYFGYVDYIYTVNDSKIYDIQVGGQCPAIIRGIKEETIFVVEKKKTGE